MGRLLQRSVAGIIVTIVALVIATIVDAGRTCNSRGMSWR